MRGRVDPQERYAAHLSSHQRPQPGSEHGLILLIHWWQKICLHQWHLYYINSCNPPTRRHGCDWFQYFCRDTYTHSLCTWEWNFLIKACNCFVATAPLTTMQVFHFSEIMKQVWILHDTYQHYAVEEYAMLLPFSPLFEKQSPWTKSS